jgi:recombination protein RecR
MERFAETVSQTAAEMKICETCGNLDTRDPCNICTDPKREENLLCIVAGVADLWAIERTGFFKGRYHVLGGVLSALDGITPDQLALSQLEDRLARENISEIILALNATVDGQSTAHYISDMMRRHHNQIRITRLAHGMPVGGELDYLDDGTIMTALKSRSNV